MGVTVITVVKLPTCAMILEAAQPNTIPIRPPIIPITMDSIKNWVMMFIKVAPNALRIPISRVRSVTDIEPTIREIPAIAPKSSVSMEVDWLTVSIRLVRLRTWKSSSLPAVI